MATAYMDPISLDADKLSSQIFSILESKFLFGYDDAKVFHADAPPAVKTAGGRVRVLSMDGGEHASDALLAGAALVRLETSLQRYAGDPAARVADFFDVAAGSGAGGVLAAMLVARGPRGRPLFSAEEALAFLRRSGRRGWSARDGVGGRRSGRRGWSARLPSAARRRRSARCCFLNKWKLRACHFVLLRSPWTPSYVQVFGELTLRDTVCPVLVPCYDLATAGPFLFSVADASKARSHDFRLRGVCAATRSVDETRSVDGKTRVMAVGGGVALGNPTAAAITHVLNNMREFPLSKGLEDLLVISIASSDGERKVPGHRGGGATTSDIVRIATEGVADMVDQSVAMAFGHKRASNYLRIQAVGAPRADSNPARAGCGRGVSKQKAAGEAEETLLQRNVESVLFRGKKLGGHTNAEKLEWFAGELVKEHNRRKATLTN